MTWQLHLLLKKYLEAKGFEVITTRTEKGKDLALYDRGKKAKGCALFMSLHSNAAYSTSEVVAGQKHKSEYVDRVDVYAPLKGQMHDLAKLLADRIHHVMETDQGGFVKTRASGSGQEYYGVLRGAAAVDVPGLLVEHSFHTNEHAARWLLDQNNLDKLAKAEAEVIAAYFAEKEVGADDSDERMLRKGDEGDDVTELQEDLLKLGYNLGSYGPKGNGVDGQFGSKTDEAIKDLQKKHGLLVDGIVGPKTKELLKKLSATPAAKYQLIIEGDEATLRQIQKDHGGNLIKLN